MLMVMAGTVSHLRQLVPMGLEDANRQLTDLVRILTRQNEELRHQVGPSIPLQKAVRYSSDTVLNRSSE
jgi:hypothetical protein